MKKFIFSFIVLYVAYSANGQSVGLPQEPPTVTLGSTWNINEIINNPVTIVESNDCPEPLGSDYICVNVATLVDYTEFSYTLGFITYTAKIWTYERLCRGGLMGRSQCTQTYTMPYFYSYPAIDPGG